jgi:Mn-dependent DtxR family transcriptional regulator
MYTTIFYDVKRADVRSLRRDILQAIAELNGDTKGVSVERIAEHLDCGVATVYRHLYALKKSGYIQTGNNKPQIYTFSECGKRVLNGIRK